MYFWKKGVLDGRNMEQNYISRNTKHNIVYLFEFYSDILPYKLSYLALKRRKILNFSVSDEIFG